MSSPGGGGGGVGETYFGVNLPGGGGSSTFDASFADGKLIIRGGGVP